METIQPSGHHYTARDGVGTAGVVLALAAFCLAFVVAGDVYLKRITPGFPVIGNSAALATLWGVVSRLHVLLPAAVLILWKPRLFGFQVGRIRQNWRMLLVMLLVNCGVIAAYLLLTGGGTPYSGDQWLLTEIITVPVVEETIWRGIIFTILVLALRKFHPERTSQHLAVWLSGIAFGLLHFMNAAYGVTVSFALIQALNAVVWGVVYGYARSKTESVYPAMFLHAAMNAIVVLL